MLRVQAAQGTLRLRQNNCADMLRHDTTPSCVQLVVAVGLAWLAGVFGWLSAVGGGGSVANEPAPHFIESLSQAVYVCTWVATILVAWWQTRVPHIHPEVVSIPARRQADSESRAGACCKGHSLSD